MAIGEKMKKVFLLLIILFVKLNLNAEYYAGPLILIPGYGGNWESTYRDSKLIDYFNSYGIATYPFNFNNTSNGSNE